MKKSDLSWVNFVVCELNQADSSARLIFGS